MLPDLRFHLSLLLISSYVFSGSGGTETELADLGETPSYLPMLKMNRAILRKRHVSVPSRPED